MPRITINIYLTTLTCLLLFLAGCKNELIIPPVYHQTVFLDTVLVEPTEIDLHLTTSDSVHTPSTLFQVRRDSVIIFSRFILQKDTVIVDTGLLPSHVYKYKALRLKNSLRTDSSKLLSLRTMDTTSHNFVWEVDTLGDGNSSILRDVAIINDTCVWAVGALHVKDSAGHFTSITYNAARWNGKNWSLLSVPTAMYGGFLDTFELYSVIAFNVNDVWTYCAAGSYSHWDGSSWSTQYFDGNPGVPSKFWGTNSSNLYLVGSGGTISHYDGTTWQKMDSGTDVDLTDVWGSPDGSIVWACGYNSSKPGTALLKNDHGSGWQIAYDGTATELTLRIDSLSGMLSNVWCNSTKRLFVASQSGLYKAGSNTHGEAERISFTSSNFPGFPRGTRGNGVNDLTIVGDYTMIAHYNGASWRYFSEYQTNDRHFNAVAQIGNMIVGVGIIDDPINSKGFVFIGRR
jgi:hypothetical protein